MSLFTFNDRSGRLVLAGGLLALAGGMIAGGCGGTGDLSRVEDFCLALAQVDCSQAVVTACYNPSDATFDTDTQNCIRSRSATANCNPQGLPYHSASASQCLDQHAAVYGAGQLDAMSLKLIEQACLPVFNRGGGVGVACTDDTDCDAGSGLSCIVHQGGNGTCRVPFDVMAGENCNDPSARCMDGLYCESTGHCVADPGKGEACEVGVPCDTGFRCDMTTAACVDQLADGATCTSNADCAGGFCIGTASGGSKCAATYTLAFGSATCLPFM